MKYLGLVLLISVSFAVISCAMANAVPEVVYDGPVYDLIPIEDNLPEPEMPIRARRVTCDLLSFTSQWVSVNHSACAARCLVQRRKGGRCSNGVCVCRG